MILTLSESDQYSSVKMEISKLPLKYMMGYFCRSVYFISLHLHTNLHLEDQVKIAKVMSHSIFLAVYILLLALVIFITVSGCFLYTGIIN